MKNRTLFALITLMTFSVIITGCYFRSDFKTGMAIDPEVNAQIEYADQLGDLHKTGQYGKIIASLTSMLKAEEAKKEPDQIKIALILHELSVVYLRRIFNYEKAKIYIDKCSQMLADSRVKNELTQGKSSYRDVPPYSGNLLTRNYGEYVVVYRTLDYEKLQNSLALMNEELNRLSKQEKKEAHKLSENERDELKGYITEFQSLLNTPTNSKEYRQIISRLSLFNFRLGNNKEGLAYLDTLIKDTQQKPDDPNLKLWNSFMPPALQLEMIYLAADYLSRANRHADSMVYWQWSIDLYEEFRSSIEEESDRVELFANLSILYRNAVSEAFHLDQRNELLVLIERSKSRTLLESLDGKALAVLSKKDTQTIQEFENAAKVSIETTGKRTLARKKMATGHQLNILTYSSSYLPPADFVDKILHLSSSTAFMNYYILDNEIVTVLVSGGAIFTRKIALSDNKLSEIMRRLYFSEKVEEVSIAKNSKELKDLYSLLIKPLESKLVNIRHIVFIPSGKLHNLPFNALHDGKKYLIEKWAVSSVPSMSVFLSLMERGKNIDESNMLAIANPDYKGAAPQLPGTYSEVVGIGKMWKGTTIKTGDDASKSYIMENASQFKILHLATHGIFNPESPSSSFLLMASNTSDDGRLSIKDIFSLKLDKTSLVVLSACQTNMAQIKHGDESYGFFRSFTYAGAVALVASLWDADDLVTSDLMNRFYLYLSRGDNVSHALQKAQIDMIKKGYAPHLWSLFQLNGNPYLKKVS